MVVCCVGGAVWDGGGAWGLGWGAGLGRWLGVLALDDLKCEGMMADERSKAINPPQGAGRASQLARLRPPPVPQTAAHSAAATSCCRTRLWLRKGAAGRRVL